MVMVIDDIIKGIFDTINNAVGWIWTNSPWWLKTAIFLAVFSLVIYVFAAVFNSLGIGHRILQPKECASVVTILANAGTFNKESDCLGLSNCVNGNNINSCVCGCIERTTSANPTGCGDWDIWCELNTPPSAINYTYQLTCSQNSFGFNVLPNRCEYFVNDSDGENVFNQCVGDSNISSVFKHSQICSKLGFDVLDPTPYVLLTVIFPIGALLIKWYGATGILRPPI